MGGRDKPLLSLGSRTILAEILGRLEGQAQAIALSANGDPSRFAAYHLPVLPDPTPDQGPLAGVLEGLKWAASLGAEALLTVPGDTPFIPRDLAQRLQPAPAGAGSRHPARARLRGVGRRGQRRDGSGAGGRMKAAPALFGVLVLLIWRLRCD